MARRLPLLRNGYFYHVFNRGVEHRPAFTNKKEYSRAITAMLYYKYGNLPIKLSRYLTFSLDRRSEFLSKVKRNNPQIVSIICYCLMPNHFHFLLKQENENGISTYLSNFQNSYTKYFNTRNDRDGHLFKGNFKAVRLETDNQLLHVSRYIHLNPFVSSVVESPKELLNYPWSSFREYLNGARFNVCDRKIITSFFKDTENYKNFVLNEAEYQKRLDSIKHLILE